MEPTCCKPKLLSKNPATPVNLFVLHRADQLLYYLTLAIFNYWIKGHIMCCINILEYSEDYKAH